MTRQVKRLAVQTQKAEDKPNLPKIGGGIMNFAPARLVRGAVTGLQSTALRLAAGFAPGAPTEIVRAKMTFTAGALIRRQVENGIRQYLDQQDDLTYNLSEYKRWLDSDFLLTIQGPRASVDRGTRDIQHWFNQIAAGNS